MIKSVHVYAVVASLENQFMMLALNFHAVLAFWKTGWRAGSGLGIGAIATAGDVVIFIKSGRRVCGWRAWSVGRWDGGRRAKVYMWVRHAGGWLFHRWGNVVE